MHQQKAHIQKVPPVLSVGQGIPKRKDFFSNLMVKLVLLKPVWSTDRRLAVMPGQGDWMGAVVFFRHCQIIW